MQVLASTLQCQREAVWWEGHLHTLNSSSLFSARVLPALQNSWEAASLEISSLRVARCGWLCCCATRFTFICTPKQLKLLFCIVPSHLVLCNGGEKQTDVMHRRCFVVHKFTFVSNTLRRFKILVCFACNLNTQEVGVLLDIPWLEGDSSAAAVTMWRRKRSMVSVADMLQHCGGEQGQY